MSIDLDEYDIDPEEIAEADRAFWASPLRGQSWSHHYTDESKPIRRHCAPEAHISMPWRTLSCLETFPTYDDIPF